MEINSLSSIRITSAQVMRYDLPSRVRTVPDRPEAAMDSPTGVGLPSVTRNSCAESPARETKRSEPTGSKWEGAFVATKVCSVRWVGSLKSKTEIPLRLFREFESWISATNRRSPNTQPFHLKPCI